MAADPGVAFRSTSRIPRPGNAGIVWEQDERRYFIGSKPSHPFLSSIVMRWVSAQVDRELIH